MRKRNRTPVAGSLAALADHSIFKGKSRNKLRGWFRPQRTIELRPLAVDYSHR